MPQGVGESFLVRIGEVILLYDDCISLLPVDELHQAVVGFRVIHILA